ncbi:acyltransferase [bacterium]|nr:acyltransferase [bacterium]
MPPKRKNNFDFLRLLLAVAVLRCHGNLVGYPQPWTEDQYFLGGLSAVECFFVISGYLIFRSWESSPSLAVFAEKRSRRILPAYLFVVIACTLGFSGLSTLGIAGYFQNHETYQYLFANLSFLGFLRNTLPGVFEGNYQEYVNGPLWTIKVEVMFYISVPIVCYLATKFPRAILFSILYVCSVAWSWGFKYLADANEMASLIQVAEQLPGQMAFFVAGGTMYYARSFIDRNIVWLAALSIAAIACYYNISRAGFAIVYPMALSIAVIGFANHFFYLGNFGRFGDFSYGIYIFHYPIFQVLAALEIPLPPAVLFVLGTVLTFLAAIASWYYLESRWLLKSSHYIRASEAESKRQTDFQDAPLTSSRQL